MIKLRWPERLRIKKQKNKGLHNTPLPRESTAHTDGDPSTAPTLTDLKLSGIISSIKQLPLTSFIQAAVYDDLTVLALDKSISRELLVPVWDDLQSQYYTARGDEGMMDYLKKSAKLYLLKARLSRVNLLFSWLEQDGYVETICAILRSEYKLPFSADTYLKDCDTARKKEVRAVLEHDRLEKEVEAQNKKTTQQSSKESQEESFYQMVMNINQVEKGSYSVEHISTYQYAIACKRYDKYIEHMERQTSGNG